MLAAKDGRLACATLLAEAGADIGLLSGRGRSARQIAEQLVERDANPLPHQRLPMAPDPPTAEERAEHVALIAMLVARGAA